MSSKACPSCGGNALYQTTFSAGGPFGPNLLPGIGSVLTGAELEATACGDCGHLSLFVPPQYRDELSRSKKWREAD